ncbi:hypothetical protein ACYSUW_13845 [Pseudomonas frederiksbergensis]
MFFDDVKTAWEAGKVRVHLAAVGYGVHVTLRATGWTRLKAALLCEKERQELAKLAKMDAYVDVESLPDLVENWTPEQLTAVRKLVVLWGIPKEYPGDAVSPQRRLLEWEGGRSFSEMEGRSPPPAFGGRE